VGDKDLLEVFRQKLEEHLTQYVSCNGTHFNEVKQNSKIQYDPTDELRCNNRYNIDFIPNSNNAGNLAEAQRFFLVIF